MSFFLFAVFLIVIFSIIYIIYTQLTENLSDQDLDILHKGLKICSVLAGVPLVLPALLNIHSCSVSRASIYYGMLGVTLITSMIFNTRESLGLKLFIFVGGTCVVFFWLRIFFAISCIGA